MKKVIIIVIFLMVLGSGSYIFFQSNYFNIENIEIIGKELNIAEDTEDKKYELVIY